MGSPWTVYMLRCCDGSLYTGATVDLARRVVLHQAGRGAAYTRARRPVTLVWSEPVGERGAALRREHALKCLTRAQKLALVSAAAKPSKPARRAPADRSRERPSAPALSTASHPARRPGGSRLP